jgi:hypothetical protein
MSTNFGGSRTTEVLSELTLWFSVLEKGKTKKSWKKLLSEGLV